MFFIVASMLVVLVISALVVAYVAFADRGEKLPGAAWLGEAMERAKDAAPTLAEEPGGERSESDDNRLRLR